MSGPPVRAPWIVWLVPALWFGGGVMLLVVTGSGGSFADPFGALMVFSVWSTCGLACLVIVGVYAWRARWSRHAILLALSMPAALSVLAVIDSPIASLQTTLYFRQLMPTYERVIEELGEKGSREESHGTSYGVAYGVEPGPPERVVFPWPGGLLDNWVGVVYDPTGFVMMSNRFRPDWSNWDDPELAAVKKLFGGDMTRCLELAPSWYLCSFT